MKWQLAVDQAKCELDDLNTKFRTSQESNKMTACVETELSSSPSLQVEIDAREKTIKQLTERSKSSSLFSGQVLTCMKILRL